MSFQGAGMESLGRVRQAYRVDSTLALSVLFTVLGSCLSVVLAQPPKKVATKAREQATPRTSLVSARDGVMPVWRTPSKTGPREFKWSNSPKDQEDKTANEMRPRLCWSDTILNIPP